MSSKYRERIGEFCLHCLFLLSKDPPKNAIVTPPPPNLEMMACLCCYVHHIVLSSSRCKQVTLFYLKNKSFLTLESTFQLHPPPAMA
jgi:hypothetical protein